MVTHSNAFFGFSYPIHFLLGRCTLLLISKCGSMTGPFSRIELLSFDVEYENGRFDNWRLDPMFWCRNIRYETWLRRLSPQNGLMIALSGKDVAAWFSFSSYLLLLCLFFIWLSSQLFNSEAFQITGPLAIGCSTNVVSRTWKSCSFGHCWIVINQLRLRVVFLYILPPRITVLKKVLLFGNFSYCFRRAFRAVEFHAIGVCTYFLWYFKAVL